MTQPRINLLRKSGSNCENVDIIKLGKLDLPPSCDNTGILIISCEADLETLAGILLGKDRFAFDTEHSSDFNALCLIQLSFTGYDFVDVCHGYDFIVDVCQLGYEAVARHLKAPFESLKILKVAHGSDNDLIWLKGYCGISVNNLCDIQQNLTKIPGYKGRKDLASIVCNFCGFQLDKSMRRTNFTKRPFTPEMENYARLDSHFLLAIYDKMARAAMRCGNEMGIMQFGKPNGKTVNKITHIVQENKKRSPDENLRREPPRKISRQQTHDLSTDSGYFY